MKNLTILYLFLIGTASAQDVDYFTTEFLLGSSLNPENLITKYEDYDFSEIWTITENSRVYGVIGEDHQRLRLKFISVEKNPFDANEYIVYGKSMVKNTICEFTGVIRINQVRAFKEFHFGVDDEYQGKGIKAQGILVGEYEFREDKEHMHSGVFKGRLGARWYLDENDKILYDDIQKVTDGYVNNVFIGVWKSHQNNNEKRCNWGDYRVPMCKEDFDIGVAELSVSERYRNNGWEDIVNGDSSVSKNAKWWE